MSTKRNSRQRKIRQRIKKRCLILHAELEREVDCKMSTFLDNIRRKSYANCEKIERRNRSVFCYTRPAKVRGRGTPQYYCPQVLHFRDGFGLIAIGELGNDLGLPDLGFERIGNDWYIGGLDIVGKIRIQQKLLK